MYKCSIRVKLFGSSTEVQQATFYTKWCSQNMTISPVKYKFLFSVSGTNVLPPSSQLCTFYHLSKLTEEMLVFGTLSHSLAVQLVSLHLLANFLQNA